MNEKMIVVDFGSQYNQLIVRRIRTLGVFCELVHPDDVDHANLDQVIGIILSGGPFSVYEKDAPTINPALYETPVPVLGICYGMQLMAHQLAGRVEAKNEKEYGQAMIHIQGENILTDGLFSDQHVWMSHGDVVSMLPPGFVTTAFSKTTPNAMIRHLHKPWFGVQFHPEVVHTNEGMAMLERFVGLCGAKRDWTMQNFVEEAIRHVRETVKDDHVICALSGGVDSSVVAMLLHRAIGKQVTPVFVDHGLLRKGEAEEVVKTFKDQYGMDLVKVDATDQFLEKLKGVSDPEAKRKIIGHTFIRVFEHEMKQLKSVKWLAQGTLYTDVIESGTKTAQTIKSHHNVGGLPKDMKLDLIEPLNLLFKDEVRALGLVLGLPASLVNRQPFPGPGLAIRILGDVTRERLELVRESDHILREEIEHAGLSQAIWQYFTVLTPLKTVGVMGDKRTYDHVVAIRAVHSIDGMTAAVAKIPYNVLTGIATRIVNEVDGINRVVYDITSKPPATIEWE